MRTSTGTELLDIAALRAATSWQFEPSTTSNATVAICFDILGAFYRDCSNRSNEAMSRRLAGRHFRHDALFLHSAFSLSLMARSVIFCGTIAQRWPAPFARISIIKGPCWRGVAIGVFSTLAISGQIKLLMRHRDEL